MGKGKKKGKYGVSMYSFSITPNSTKDLRFAERLSAIEDAAKREEVAFRLKVIEFHDKYGTEATVSAFGVSRATIYLWKKKFRESGGKLESLISKPRRPRRVRQKSWRPEIIDFILKFRKAHPGIGKEKLKPFVDEFCDKKGLPRISVSTIGRIIKYLKERGLLRGEGGKKLSYYARSGRFYEREKRRRRRKRFKRQGGLKPGDLVQVDSIVYFLNGIRRYLVVGIDLASRFAFAYGYSHLSSRKARDFMEKFREVAPFEVRGVQTDNGSEFLGEFDRYLREVGIEHYFNYPRNPKGNGYVERFNRTLEEDFIDFMEEVLREDLKRFNRGLMEYLIWYNGERPHFGLRNKSPLRWYCEDFLKNTSQSKMIWTYTGA